jgi:hypothetical protein
MTEHHENSAKPKGRVVMARLVRRDQHSDRSFDLEFWEKVGARGRFAAAWQMIREIQLMRGLRGELPRMQKSVTRIIRRSQAGKPDDSSKD